MVTLCIPRFKEEQAEDKGVIRVELVMVVLLLWALM